MVMGNDVVDIHPDPVNFAVVSNAQALDFEGKLDISTDTVNFQEPSVGSLERDESYSETFAVSQLFEQSGNIMSGFDAFVSRE